MYSQPTGRKRKKPLKADQEEENEKNGDRRCFSQLEQLAHNVSLSDSNSSITESKGSSNTPTGLLLCDRFAPKTYLDVAVNSSKIKELISWLEQAATKRSCLFLTGPPGSGKSTAVRLLCSSLKIAVQECDYEDVLSFRQKSNTLFFENDSEQLLTFIRSHDTRFVDSSVVKLIEYLPSVAYTDTFDFRELLRHAVRRSPHSLIFCLSDVQSCYDVSPHKLFSAVFLNEEGYTTINFNPIAKGIVCKALKRTRDLLNGRRKITDAMLNEIAELGHGDIRLCFNILHFSMNSDSGELNIDSALQSALCDEKFHMIGRILHSHRVETLDSRPDWLSEDLHRPSPEHDISRTLEMSNLHDQELSLYLHEQVPKFAPSLKATAHILEAFSFADSMTDRWDVRLKMKGESCEKNSWRADEYHSQIVARTIYFYNYKATNTNFNGFKRPKWKDLSRQIWGLSNELQQTICFSRLGFDTGIQQIAMFSNLRIFLQMKQYDVINYIIRPFTWLWHLGRQQWHNKEKLRQFNSAKSIGAAVLISKNSSAFPEFYYNMELEQDNEEEIFIEDSDQEKTEDDSFDEDPF